VSLALRISGRVAQALKAEAISSMGDELFNTILRMLCVGVHSTAPNRLLRRRASVDAIHS
jgi:hypothetical protein